MIMEESAQTRNTGSPAAKPGGGDSLLLSLMGRFSRSIHLLLGISLAVASVMVVALFIGDVFNAFTQKTFVGGFLHAVGSLLILWTFSELLQSEIRHLKGGKVEVAAFIEVAIAATIRHTLIAATEPFDLQSSLLTLGQLAILGIVYWLISISALRR